MTYLASADLLAVRSLSAEHAFSLNHRTDLPPTRKAPDQNAETPRARIFTAAHPPKTTTSTDVLPAPKGRHHRPDSDGNPHPAKPRPTSKPEPIADAPGYTVIDLRHRRVRWHYTPTNSTGKQREQGYGMLIDLDTYRTRALRRLCSTNPPRTPARPTGQIRRRSSRVRGYVHLAPDERAEFATLRNTIRRYLAQRDSNNQNRQAAS